MKAFTFAAMLVFASHPIYLFQVKTPAESKYSWDYYKLIAEVSPERAFRPLAEGGCPFLQH